MLSKSQQIAKSEKVKRAVTEFLSSNVSIEELSKKIKISPSAIQRYLHDVDEIQLIYGADTKKILLLIREKLAQSKKEGLSRGGSISTTNNEPIRDENGKFTGNRKR